MGDRADRLRPARRVPTVEEMDRAQKLRDFRKGWLAGVDLICSGTERRALRVVDLAVWRAGREQGRAAAEAALWAYEQKLKAERELLGEEKPHA